MRKLPPSRPPRTSPSLDVTGTTDRIRKNGLNIRTVLTQKIAVEKRALTRTALNLKKLQAALKALLS